MKRNVLRIMLLTAAAVISSLALAGICFAEEGRDYTAGSTIKSNQGIESIKAFKIMSMESWIKNEDGTFNDGNGKPLAGAISKGLDISKWQGKVDWAKVKASDIDFVILRCGYRTSSGSICTDEKWNDNVKACEKYGIPYGVYFYSVATSDSKIKSEITRVKALLKGHAPSYPVYIDQEDKKLKAKGKSFIAKAAKAFCQDISAAGYVPGIYASKSWFDSYLTSSTFDKYEKWIAQWNNSGSTYKKSYGMWQCTSSYTSPGISGRVDLNFAYKPYKGYIAEYWSSENGKDVCMRYPQTEQVIDGQTYKTYDIENPYKVTNEFVTYDGSIYYMGEDGYKTTGIKAIGDKKYIFDSKGNLKKNAWVQVDGKYYYAISDGTFYMDTYKTIGDYSYGFDKNGARIVNKEVAFGDNIYKLSKLNGRSVINKATLTKKIPYRKGPSSKYSKKGYAKKGTSVEVIRVKGSYSMVTNGYWLATKYLKVTQKYPYVYIPEAAQSLEDKVITNNPTDEASDIKIKEDSAMQNNIVRAED